MGSQPGGNKPLKLKSVKGKSKVGEIRLLLTSSRLFLLACVSHNPAAKGPPKPL